MWYIIPNDELYHHGIKGQRWGVRRFQNPDGTLTKEGVLRYKAKERRKKIRNKIIRKELFRDRRKQEARKEALKAVSGIAVATALTAAAIAYASHKDQIDSIVLTTAAKSITHVSSDAHKLGKKVARKTISSIGDISMQMLKTAVNSD